MSFRLRLKQLRVDRNWTQAQLAEKLMMSRPQLTNWENGNGEPSASQVIKIAKVFSISLDDLMGVSHNAKDIVVVDSSVLLKRPVIIDELISKFYKVVIPFIVMQEINHVKDKSYGSLKQRAWLTLANIGKHKNVVEIKKCETEGQNNDEKIAFVAKIVAKEFALDKIYMLSDDIYFQFLNQDVGNVESICLRDYEIKFKANTSNFDTVKSNTFFDYVKKRNFIKVKNMDTSSVDINKINPQSGFTPLIQAVRNKDEQMIDYLCKLSNIDVQDEAKYGFTALHHAVQLKNIEIVKILLNLGADVDTGSSKQNSGNTPLMVASWSGFTDCAEYLIQEGACLNQQDNNGFTPLIKACIRNHFEIAEMLISNTDKAIRSKERKKAIQYVNMQNDVGKKIMELFMKENDDR